MDSNRKTAVMVGVLFLIALVFDLVAMAMYDPVLNAPDFLNNASPNAIKVIGGILLDFIAAIAIVLIPIMLYPILKQHNEALALGYVGFRFLEGILFIFSAIKSLSLVSLSQEYIAAGAHDASCFEILGSTIHAQNHWSTLIYIIVFTIGALMFYKVLFVSKLLPRFISIWGIAAVGLLMAGALIGLFELFETSNIMLLLGPPVALNEITLSIWLFAKGFNSSADVSERT
jgi:hypothetical protein